jgi:hypothetical protein
LATTLAFFPGVLFHGSGHIYAGSYFKGASLLVLEGASAWLLIQNGQNLIDDGKRITESSSGNGTPNIPNDLSSLTSRFGVCTVMLAGFIYTWLDDMGGAGIAAEKYNLRAQAASSKARMTLSPSPDGQGVLLGYSAQF